MNYVSSVTRSHEPILYKNREQQITNKLTNNANAYNILRWLNSNVIPKPKLSFILLARIRFKKRKKKLRGTERLCSNA